MNLMYLEGTMLGKQLEGLIVCIPKHAQAKTIDDYRPLTLMNTDYKILTRIIAERLRPFMPIILHPNQLCGVQVNSVFEAVTVVREAILYAETTKKPICIVSIDFSAAFDKISHEYLYKVLSKHGFDDTFIQQIKRLCDNATSEIQINSFRSGQIQIKRSVRQGCPFSMLIYALCLNPLIQSLEKHLSGIKIGRRRTKTAVTAYADDVTIYLTQVEDIPKMEEILQRYESASGAKINMQKSRAMTNGNWDTTIPVVDIQYHKDIKILGFHFSNSVNSTAAES